MMDLIRIEAEPRKRIPVDLVGKRYEIVPPKASFALKFAVNAQLATQAQDSEKVARVIDEWIEAAFGAEADAVKARLNDPADALDTNHIGMLMRAIMEASTGDPTTSA